MIIICIFILIIFVSIFLIINLIKKLTKKSNKLDIEDLFFIKSNLQTINNLCKTFCEKYYETEYKGWEFKEDIILIKSDKDIRISYEKLISLQNN